MSQEKNQHLMIVITIVSTVMAGTGVYMQWLDRNAKQAELTVQTAAPIPPSIPHVTEIPAPTTNQLIPRVNKTPVEQVSDLTVQTISAPDIDKISLKKTKQESRDGFTDLPPLSQDLDMPDLKMGKDDF